MKKGISSTMAENAFLSLNLMEMSSSLRRTVDLSHIPPQSAKSEESELQ